MFARLEPLILWPLLLTQGLYTASRAIRIEEPEGPRTGIMGDGPPFRLLVLGDSSAAGVGVDHQKDALGMQLAERFSAHFEVSWRVRATSGATTASTLADWQGDMPGPCDLAVLALGVNDTKNGVSLGAWRRNYGRLVQDLSEAGARRVIVSGLPPVGEFPLLPNPLRRVLGQRASRFDDALQEVAAAAGAVHLPFDLPFDPALMARDGFHPGPVVYREWAARIYDRVMLDFELP